MEILREAPKASSFVPLIEHQSATPASFYSGPPVLHYYSDRSKLIILEHEIGSVGAFAPLLERPTCQTRSQPHANGTEGTNGNAEEPQEQGVQKVVVDVDVWVTSEYAKLFLYCSSASTGLSIPYPSISLHAIQSLPQPSASEQQGVYMQLASFSEDSDGAGEDNEPDSISLTVIPTASAPPAITTLTDDSGVVGEDQPEQTPVMAMFTALSNCSNLHPDPVDPGDEEGEDGGTSRLFRAGLAFPGASDGGLPPAMPGSGGWITAENMHEFVDEDGNWIEDKEEEEEEDVAREEPLGPGAGTVRARDEGDQGNGDAGDEDETKWRRTS